MARKVGRPKKPPKKNNPKFFEDEFFHSLNPEFTFDDEVFVKADGEYDWCDKLMTEDSAPDNWCIVSGMLLQYDLGMCRMKLEFYGNRNVVIVSYDTSNWDAISNADIRCLNFFCDANGWNKPTPLPFVVKENVDFWKHMWSTYQVDSDYMDKYFGERQ